MRSLVPHSARDLDPAELAAAYAVAAPGTRQLRVNMAGTLDGAAEVGGVSAGVSGPADKDAFRTLRSLADVVMVGQQTAIDEKYRPAKPGADGTPPPIAIIARTMRMDPQSPFFTEAESRPILLVTDTTDLTDYADAADFIRCGPAVNLGVALSSLARHGLSRVLCEGGPRITRELLAAGLVDELCLTISPLVAGPGRKGIIGGAPLDSPARFTLGQLLEQDGFLFARYVRE